MTDVYVYGGGIHMAVVWRVSRAENERSPLKAVERGHQMNG